MIVTKQELEDVLTDRFGGTILNHGSLRDKFVSVLDWHDDEPRDITHKDIELVEDLIAEELDRLLTLLEKNCFSKS